MFLLYIRDDASHGKWNYTAIYKYNFVFIYIYIYIEVLYQDISMLYHHNECAETNVSW